MPGLEENARLRQWIVEKVLREDPEAAEWIAVHQSHRAKAKGFLLNPPFLETRESRKVAERFLFGLARANHPSLPAILDVDSIIGKDTSERMIFVYAPRETEPFAANLAEARLGERRRALAFLDAFGRMAQDFHSLDIACDRLTAADVAWDGVRLDLLAICWSALISGDILQRMPHLMEAWEKRFPSGVYVTPSGPPPVERAISHFARMAYVAAGVEKPEERLRAAAEENAKGGGEEFNPLDAPPLVEGWGIAFERFARRCLFSQMDGMIRDLSTFGEEIAAFMRAKSGGASSPARETASASVPGAAAPARPRSSARAGTLEDSTGGGGAGANAPDSGLAAPPASRKAEEPPRSPREEKTPAPESETRRSATPPRPRAAAGRREEFRPLGMEAAMLERPAMSRARSDSDHEMAETEEEIPRKKRKKGGEGIPLPSLRWILGALAALLIITAVIVIFVLMNRPKPNQPPVAAIAPPPAQVKRFEKILFDASASRDPENDPVTYHWRVETLPDGEYLIEPNDRASAATPRITFFQTGTHTVSLRLFDGNQYSAKITVTVEVK